MRILLFSVNYAPEPTATGKYTGEMAAWLASRGHEVHAVVGPPHYPRWEIDPTYRGRGWWKEHLDGVQVHRSPMYVPSTRKLSSLGRVLMELSYTASSLRWTVPMLFGPRYDVALAVCPPLQTAAIPLVMGLVHRTPWLLHIQDLQVDAALRLGMLPEGVVGNTLRWLERSVLRRAARVSTISPTMLERVLAKGVRQEHAWLFPNWADIEAIRPGPRLNPVRRRLGVPDEALLVLYSGGMGEKQGLELVLDTAERLRGRPDLRFVLVGEGGAREGLEANARERGLENVSFHDLLPWAEVPELLAAGDLHLIIQKAGAADLVLPSKLTNIMAAGRPVVATAGPGTALHTVLEQESAGLLTAPESVDELSAAILRLADEPEERRRMGGRARAMAERELGKDAILERFEAKLQSWMDG